jgi:hypothetical protein
VNATPRRPNALASALGSPAGLVLLAALLRLAFDLTKRNMYAFGDTADYEAVALQMLGKGPAPGPALARAPLFPAVMALGFVLGGLKNYAFCRLLELPFGIALVDAVMRIAARIGDRRTVLFAGLAAALAPTLVFTSSMLYPTSLYSLLLAWATLGALSLAGRPHARAAVGTGVALALGWLTDAVFIAPAAAIGLWLLVQLRTGGRPLARALAQVGLTAALIVGPWLVYRHVTATRPEITAAKAQWVLFTVRTDPAFDQARWVELPPGTTFHPRSTGAFVRSELALLAREPVAYVHDVAWEFVHFFAPMPDRIQTHNEYNQPWVLMVGAVYFTPVLALAIVGLVRGPGRRRHRALLAMVVLATATFYAFFFTQTRYRIPVEPQLILLAALGLAGLWPARAGSSAGN